MTSYPRLFVPALAALILCAPASAQVGGGGVGGVVGGVTGGVGNAVGGIGGTVGNTAGGLLGGGGGLGGMGGGGLGGMGGGLSGIGGGLGGTGLTYSNLLRQRDVSAPELNYAINPALTLNRVFVSVPLSSMPADLVADLRKARLQALIAANPRTLDRDDHGLPVRKAELVVTDPDQGSLAMAQRAGFAVVRNEVVADLGIHLITLGLPRGMNVRQAIKTLRRAAPALQVDYNHVYEPAGGVLRPAPQTRLAAAPPLRGRLRIAMIDGGVASHPSLAGASIEQRGFAGAPQPTGHGTAVGSLLVGDQGPFRGAARGAQLYVADIYGGSPAAGSVTNILRALGWAASKQPSVINISLVGPDNRALARAIAALRARGIAVTAAVGNDGPAAPAQYPASYPGVIAVTGVDARGKALPEAGRPAHLDFAAPGADMAAALPGRGYTQVRGTSFAAPLAAARLALTGSYQRLAAEAVPGKGRVGRGIVCFTCRIDPKMLRAR